MHGACGHGIAGASVGTWEGRKCIVIALCEIAIAVIGYGVSMMFPDAPPLDMVRDRQRCVANSNRCMELAFPYGTPPDPWSCPNQDG